MFWERLAEGTEISGWVTMCKSTQLQVFRDNSTIIHLGSWTLLMVKKALPWNAMIPDKAEELLEWSIFWHGHCWTVLPSWLRLGLWALALPRACLDASDCSSLFPGLTSFCLRVLQAQLSLKILLLYLLFVSLSSLIPCPSKGLQKTLLSVSGPGAVCRTPHPHSLPAP